MQPCFIHRRFRSVISLAIAALVLTWSAGTQAGENDAKLDKPPAVGDVAADFTLPKVGEDGEEEEVKVRLSALTKDGPVAIIVLRGWPGYQCPLCTRQVADLMAQSETIKELGAQVVLIYPGPAERLDERAHEFLHGKDLPEGFHMVIDPDYKFTDAYHLRWDAPRETAYPSTFVVDSDRAVHFAKVSKSHGGRTNAKEVVAAIRKIKADE